MAFTGLQQAQTHFGFLLYIDGIPEVYYSGGVAPTVSTTWPYVATPGLQEWRPESQTISPQSGIVEGGGGTVVIAETRGNGAQARLLKRRGGTTLQVTLATTIEQGYDNTTVTVNEDNSAWPASGELWIGQECMHYTSRDSGAKTFTVPAAGRGYYSSRVQRHVADAERGWAPRITSAPVAWKNRAARLFVYQIQPSGAWSTDFVQECNGYIAASPKGGRRMVELRLAPWTEFVKRKVGGTGRVTTLVSGAHVFDGTTCSIVSRGELWRQGAVMSSRAASASVGVAVVNDVVWEAHSDVYDPAGWGEPGYLVITRFFGGSLDIAEAPTGYVGSATDGTGDISLSAALTSNVNANDLIENAETDIERQVQLYTLGSPVLMAWPGEALDVINTAWAPGTNKGAVADSAYADHRIIPHVEEAGGAAIRATVNSSVHRQPLQSLLDVRFNGDYTCWYGVNLADPSLDYDWNGMAIAEHTLRRIDLHSKGGADSATPDIIPIVGMPQAFCQPPEAYVYVRDNVFQDPTSATVFVHVKAQEWDSTEFETAFQVTAVETADSVLGGGETGYLLTIAERDRFRFRAFGSWAGLREPTIYQMVQFNRYDPRVVLLELLTSEHGNGFWHATYDRRPIGAGIDSSHIDVNSFLRFPLPAGPGSTWSDDIGTEAIDLHEYLGRILTAINGIIVNRLDRSTGFRRLALIRAGSPLALESAGDITDGMWLTNGRPEDGVNEEIINSVKIRAGYDWRKREPGPPVVVNDADSIKENDRVADAEYDLRGADIDAASPGDLIAAVGPFAFEIFAQYGYEQPQARGRISYRDSLLLDPGAVVTFSATDVIDTDGGEGVAGQVARLLTMARDPTRQTCEIMVQWDNLSPTGWAPSMQVTAVIDADELTVAANAYSATTHPITGDAQTDVGFFAVGQKVRIVPAGAGFGVERTITVISGNDLTFDGAHGISSPDYGHIQPADYDDAATAHKAYAFQSDENGTLGASAVTGYDYG